MEQACIAGGDADYAQAKTAMFMAGRFTSENVSHMPAPLCHTISVRRSLVAYEGGATGPGKDCGYEDPNNAVF